MKRGMSLVLMWAAVVVLIAGTFSVATGTASANTDMKIQVAAIVQMDTAMTSASIHQNTFNCDAIKMATSNTATTIGKTEAAFAKEDGDAAAAINKTDGVNTVAQEMRHKTGTVVRIIMPMAAVYNVCA